MDAFAAGAKTRRRPGRVWGRMLASTTACTKPSPGRAPSGVLQVELASEERDLDAFAAGAKAECSAENPTQEPASGGDQAECGGG